MRKKIILNPNQAKVIKSKLDIERKRKMVKKIAYDVNKSANEKLALIRIIIK